MEEVYRKQGPPPPGATAARNSGARCRAPHSVTAGFSEGGASTVQISFQPSFYLPSPLKRFPRAAVTKSTNRMVSTADIYCLASVQTRGSLSRSHEQGPFPPRTPKEAVPCL